MAVPRTRRRRPMRTEHFRWLKSAALLITTSIATVACASTQAPPGSAAMVLTGAPARYEDPGTPGAVRGIGIEAQDLVGMTDRMMRDMLTNSALASREVPARVIIDAEYFQNESASRINKNSITDRLR